METGREEIEKFGIEESAGYKNLIAIRDYTQTTRAMFRDLQKENEIYKNQIKQLNIALEVLRKQIIELQISKYGNGATS